MPSLSAYLTFNGNCAEAMRFYEKTLSGKLDLMSFGNSPMKDQVPPGAADLILHARLEFAGNTLMASDTTPDMPYEGIKGASLALGYTTVEEARPVFDALAAGGAVRMPLDKTFWADAFGMLTDRFGVAWMFNVGPDAS